MAQTGARQLDDHWVAPANSWIREGGETLLSIKYLYNSPPMNFGLPRSLDELRLIIDACPDGAELTLWRSISLVRGTLTPGIVQEARASIPKDSECVCLFTQSGSETDPRLEGDAWHSVSGMLAELPELLTEHMGQTVAIGAWPESDCITGVKGGVEGPR